MFGDVKEYCRTCERCNVAKLPHVHVRLPMSHILASRPNEVVAMDYTLLEKSSDGREHLLVITDVFSKFSVAVPTKDETPVTTAKMLVSEWFMRYGVPERLHSDQGRNFESSLIAELLQNIQCEEDPHDSVPSPGNGQCERFNRTLHNLLRTLSTARKTTLARTFAGSVVHLQFDRARINRIHTVLPVSRAQSEPAYC